MRAIYSKQDEARCAHVSQHGAECVGSESGPVVFLARFGDPGPSGSTTRVRVRA